VLTGRGVRRTNESAGPQQNTAAMVSAKHAEMVSVEGGSWSCARWNSSAATTNTTSVGKMRIAGFNLRARVSLSWQASLVSAAIYFDSTSFSFIRNLRIRSCGQYSGGNLSGTFGQPVGAGFAGKCK